MSSIYSRLGSEVHVIEYLDRLIPGMDRTVAKEMQKCMTKQGINFHLKNKVLSVLENENKVIVKVLDNNKENNFIGDYCLIAVGRKAYTEGLNLEHIGINLDKKGKIIVDNKLMTNVKGIYAIGDVINGAMLAHKAEEEGIFVAETIKGEKPLINYRNIPNVLYTWPEAAGVGFTEDELKIKNLNYKTGSFPFKALGRARAAMETEGLVKILADAKTDEILGVHMVGARIADLIAEAVVALEFRASAEDISRISHAHPTFAEAMKEAALDAWEKNPIHL